MLHDLCLVCVLPYVISLFYNLLYSLVSAKASYKEQPLVDFICQVLNKGVQDLDNPRLFDNRRLFHQLKDAIIGKTVDRGIAACLRCCVVVWCGVVCCVVSCRVVLCCVVLCCGALCCFECRCFAFGLRIM